MQDNITNKCKKPMVSIIIPVYRTEKYLKQCVDSILEQTYSNLEVVLVDDGSPDRCPDMCDRYAELNPRIRTIHKYNEGASLARKTGINAAKGSFFMMVDGDDWLEPDTIEKCVQIAEREKSDCVLFSYIREYEDRGIENRLFDHDFNYDVEQSEKKIHQRLIGLSGQDLSAPQRIDNLSSVCMKLYRADTARKGRIVSEREVGTSEDTIFNIYALEGCRISYLNQCLYHYRKTNEQSITTAYKPGLAEKWDIMYRIFQEYLDQSGRREQYIPLFLNRVACGMIGLGLNEVSGQASFGEKSHQINKILRKPLYQEAFRKLDVTYCPLHWKLFFFLCRNKAGSLLTLMLQMINRLRSHLAG